MSEFKATLVYRASSRRARTKQRNPASNHHHQQQQQKVWSARKLAKNKNDSCTCVSKGRWRSYSPLRDDDRCSFLLSIIFNPHYLWGRKIISWRWFDKGRLTKGMNFVTEHSNVLWHIKPPVPFTSVLWLVLKFTSGMTSSAPIYLLITHNKCQAYCFFIFAMGFSPEASNTSVGDRHFRTC